MALGAIPGARHSYVVVALPGTVRREKVKWVEGPVGRNGKPMGGHMERVMVEEDAGFMVYFPRGHALRFRDERHLRQYGLHKPPRIINMTGLMDPNSPVGKLLSSQDDQREQGYRDLEKMTIQLAVAKSGQTLLPEQCPDGGNIETKEDE